MPHENLGLFDTPPSQREVRLAMMLVGILVLGFLAVVPFAHIRVGEIVAFVPVVDSAMFVGELIIAALLYAQAELFRSRALTLLASGFVFIALLLVPHALTFPGAFAPNGLLQPGVNSTAWLMIIRRLGFPVVVLLYALLKTADLNGEMEARQPPTRPLLGVSAACVLAIAATVLALFGSDLLPPLFDNRSDAVLSNLAFSNLSNMAVVLLAMTVLFRKRRSVLDMWLQVALAGWLIQSTLNMWVQARFTAGFFSLYLVMLCSHLFVLLALIGESNRLYARLALATASRGRELDRQMISMDAVTAAIAHEIGQPLAGVTLSAAAGLKSLTRPTPDIEKAIRSLRDTLEAGHRAFAVIKDIRAAFMRESGSLSEFGVNDLVRETASLLTREFAARRITLQLRLDDTLPLSSPNRAQLRRVLINLLTNAMEALSAPGAHPKCISMRSMSPQPDNVLIEVSDTGVGIAPEQMTRIFDPFFTTKAVGTGLGLSLSRTILEEHSGRLWASEGAERGTTFHLLLPCGGPAAVH